MQKGKGRKSNTLNLKSILGVTEVQNNMNLKESAEMYLRYLELEQGYSQHTIKLYRKSLEDFAEFTGDVPLSKISYRKIEDYRQSLLKQQISYKTRNLKITPVRRLFAFLNRRGINVPSLNIERFQNRNGQDKLILPSPVLIQKFLNIQGPEYVDLFVTLAFTTGMRISELMSLRYGDVVEDFSVMGKGSKQRFIPIPEATVALVRSYEQKHPKPQTDPKNPPKLFPVSLRSMQRMIQDRAERNGLEMSAHTLRHCYATFLLSKNVNLREVQELLGHTSIITTQVYTHVTNEQLKQATRKAFNS